MLGTLLFDKKGKIESPVSAYQPSAEVRDLYTTVKQAYQDGENVQTMPLQEYNGMSLITRANESQRAWLSHPDEPYEG